MKTTIIVCLLVIVFTAAAVYFILWKFSKKKKVLDNDIEKLIEDKLTKTTALKLLEEDISSKREEYFKQQHCLEEVVDKFVSVDKDRINMEQRVKDRAEELDRLNSIVAKNKQQISDAEKQKQQILKNIDENFQNDLKRLIENYEDKSEEYENKIEDLREKRNAAIQSAINEYESKNNRAFYMLQLTDNDIEDIKMLKQFEQMLHNKEILGKLIYKTYIEKPYTDLVGRVLNKESFSGIYKITNETNQMCYVGQAVDIKKRWLTHIKRAIGAEPLINNKLYPAMQQCGIENFSFEVIDRCDKNKLNERERYWQEFYKSKSYGYSIK